MNVEASVQVDRPIENVFSWYADDHVRNHPRWDPDIDLEATSDEAPGVGSVMRRRNRRYGGPIEGTMEIIEFERDAAIGVIIREGGFEMPGRATFEAVGPARTMITISAVVPDAADQQLVVNRMRRSVENIKALIESDL